MPGSVVKALAFDVFGMVVDYRSTILREGEWLNRAQGLPVDWGQFADIWHAHYRCQPDSFPWARILTQYLLTRRSAVYRLCRRSLCGPHYRSHLYCHTDAAVLRAMN